MIPHIRLPAAAKCAAGIVLAATLSSLPLPAQNSSSTGLEQFELTSKIFHNTRTIRVLLPPGYNGAAGATARFPVCIFLDGRAAFDDRGWGLVPTAKALWAQGRIPEYIFIGVDNGGSTRESTNPIADRASEFLPYPDPSWTESPPAWRGNEHPAFLLDEVLPAVTARYRVAGDSGMCLAGDSYAGIAALYAAMQHPDRIKRLLLESPSLHVGSGRFLTDAKRQAAWPERVYLGVGTAEGESRADRQEMVDNAENLSDIISKSSTVSVKLKKVSFAAHSYDAWRARLPEALTFLLGSGTPKP